MRDSLIALWQTASIAVSISWPEGACGRPEKDLPCRKLQHEEHRTADQFAAHKKLK